MIRKYTVKRIDVDYYTVSEEELITSIKAYRDTDGDFKYRVYTKWDFICSSGGQWPEYDIPQQAQKRNPRIALRKNGDSYTFYACVYHFPEPRLIGKWEDYTSAYGWE